MITQHYDPLAHNAGLSGLTVTAEGVIKPDWKSWTLPDYYKVTEYKNLSKADQKKSDQFYQALSKLTGRSVAQLFSERNRALNSAEWVWCVIQALREAGGVSGPDAAALGNLAGGAALVKTIFGDWSNKPLSESDYLDPETLRAIDDNVILADALLRLRKANPGAHEYLVRLIGAKAAKRAAQVSINVGQDRQKVIDAIGQGVATVAQTGADIVKGGLSTVGAVGTFAQYLPWIIGGTLVLSAVLLYRNRGTVVQFAATRAGLR